MPDTMAGAAVLSVIDMLVVFAVLTSLVGVLLIEHRVLGRRTRPGAEAQGTPAEDAQVVLAMAAYLAAEGSWAAGAGATATAAGAFPSGPPAHDGAAAWAAAGRRAMMEKRRQVQGGLGR